MSKLTKNQEAIVNSMWRRNLQNSRKISINIDDILDESFLLLRELLNCLKTINDTDAIGILLSLFTCAGYLASKSTVNISNQTSNLNIFVLLIGPSGIGKRLKLINTMCFDRLR